MRYIQIIWISVFLLWLLPFGQCLSQTNRYTFRLDPMRLDQAIAQIERHTPYSFFYDAQTIDLKSVVSVNADNQPIEQILRQLFRGVPIEFEVNNQQIALMVKSGGGGRFYGVVCNEQGDPIAGAIVETQTEFPIETVTDRKGNFSLALDPGVWIEIRHIGYTPLLFVFDSSMPHLFTLREAPTSLNELVVVGFDNRRKERLTGAVFHVKAPEILGYRPISNPMAALQGIVPGLQVLINSGQPGAIGLDLSIRGFASINGGEPLILVDNVPHTLEGINPLEIESVTVLMDAASASIYGARAAFGVILITTKKGKKNSPTQINYSTTLSLSNASDIVEKASTLEFVTALNQWGETSNYNGFDVGRWLNLLQEYKRNPERFPNGKAMVETIVYPLKDYNMMKDFMGNSAFSQLHNLNVSGGTERSCYRLSLSYSDEQGPYSSPNDRYTKWSVKGDWGFDVTTWLKAQTNLAFTNALRSDPYGDYYSAITFNAYTESYGIYHDSDGIAYPFDAPSNMEYYGFHPLSRSNNIRLFGKLEAQATDQLTFHVEYTHEINSLNRESGDNQIPTFRTQNFQTQSGNPLASYFRTDHQDYRYHAANLYGQYNPLQLNDHELSWIGGVNYERGSIDRHWVMKTDLMDLSRPSIATAKGIMTSDESADQWAIAGYFSRINYGYQGRFLAELNGRYDGSSRFASGHKFRFFPSLSVGWLISREQFMQNNSVCSLLKVRTSWGEVGNQNTASFYPSTTSMPTYYGSWLNDSQMARYRMVRVPQLVDRYYSWEQVETINIGFDLSFFLDRLSGSIDFFSRKTKGMLAARIELPAILGVSAPRQNVADLRSDGWEFNLGWRDQVESFRYNVRVSLSDNQARITKFNNPAGLINSYYVGRQIGEIWGYVSDGFYSVADFEEGSLDHNLMNGRLRPGVVSFKGITPNPGDTKYLNLDGDEVIFSGNGTLSNRGDLTVIGNSLPRYQFGVFANATYRNFDFSWVVNGIGKRDYWLDHGLFFPYPDEFTTIYKHQLDYWTPEHTEAFYPRNYAKSGGNSSYNRLIQSKYLINAAYLKLQNVTIGYSLPVELLRRVRINKVRLFVIGENLYTFSRTPKGLNPEILTQISNEGSFYPMLRSVSCGLNILF